VPFLDQYQFNKMDNNGFIDPCDLRFAQPECSKDFMNAKHGDVYKLASLLKQSPGVASNLPYVEIGEFNSMIWSFDTRRLVALQMARRENIAVVGLYKKITTREVAGRLANFAPGESRCGILCWVRQGGINSTRIVHCNPEYDGVNLDTSLNMTDAEYQSGLRTIKTLTGISLIDL